MSTLQALSSLYERDLDRLHKEIEQYQQESNIWITEGTITNTAGNLCLHLTGNLKHFVGLHVGNIPYERDREGEFSNKDIPRETMLKDIIQTKEIVLKTLESLSAEDLEKPFPIEFGQGRPSVGYMLIHLATHLDYHLGQINYHRRILDK